MPDGIDNNAIADERFTMPVLRGMAEHFVPIGLIPLTRARREMTHADFQTKLIDQLLQA